MLKNPKIGEVVYGVNRGRSYVIRGVYGEKLWVTNEFGEFQTWTTANFRRAHPEFAINDRVQGRHTGRRGTVLSVTPYRQELGYQYFVKFDGPQEAESVYGAQIKKDDCNCD